MAIEHLFIKGTFFDGANYLDLSTSFEKKLFYIRAVEWGKKGKTWEASPPSLTCPY